MAEEKVLEVKNLHVNFHTYAGDVKAIRDVSFDLEKGQTLAIVGESGSGKSVTTKTLMGLNAKNAVIPQGELLFKGRNLLDLKEEEWQKIRGNEISMIFQDPMTSLDPTMRIGKQIAEPLLKHNKGMSKADAMKRALELMQQVGIPDAEVHINDYPHQWSGGMRQRAVIAIALAADPEILIADEPTTALDPTIQAQILKLIHDMQKEKDMSVLLITHDMGIVAENCDRVAVMYAGQILEIADVKTIFGNPAHPYTIGLLKAIPKLDEKVDRLYNIRGMVPRFNELPNGCTFGPRCDFCDKKCEEEAPQLVNMGDGHLVRCHYAGYLPERGI